MFSYQYISSDQLAGFDKYKCPPSRVRVQPVPASDPCLAVPALPTCILQPPFLASSPAGSGPAHSSACLLHLLLCPSVLGYQLPCTHTYLTFSGAGALQYFDLPSTGQISTPAQEGNAGERGSKQEGGISRRKEAPDPDLQHLSDRTAPDRPPQYSAVDTNPLSVYIMQHVWNKVVQVVPLWIAPNLLTFSGFLIIVINYLLLSCYDWDYSASGIGNQHIPNWIWISAALGNFLAYALDSIDGKHARRTQSSSPLGELFDHGLDSWTASIFPLSLFSIFGCVSGEAGLPPMRMYLVTSVVLFTFMLSHWEKYNTGILFLPWAYDISQLSMTLVYILTAIVGVETFHKPVFPHVYMTDFLITFLVGCSILIALPQTLFNIAVAYRQKTLLKDSAYEALLPLYSPSLLFILITIWIVFSPCKILDKQPRLFLWLVGVLFSNVTCRVIICQMSNTRSEVFCWLLWPLSLLVGLAVSGCLGSLEELTFFAFTAFATAAHIHYGVCVGKQLSKHFHIYVFSLKKRYAD
ncbi:ethanolaminephosphotransferase 1-like isoform X1 [Dendrobates tinctorius]|uniref:ethanolaminephosphotransferase 1-like isoform X1 n=1 Tax=Dendrobates tinctorius TaxID=92724 RepID=UPI003CC9DBC9